MPQITAILHDPKQAKVALGHVYRKALPVLEAGEKLVVKIVPETRRDNHNRHFHSLIGQIAAHVKGDLASPDDAKRILISAFKIDTLRDPDLAGEWAKFGEMRMGRGLRGEVVLLGTQSRDFTIKLARAFILWLEAFGAEAGVQFKPWRDE